MIENSVVWMLIGSQVVVLAVVVLQQVSNVKSLRMRDEHDNNLWAAQARLNELVEREIEILLSKSKEGKR